MQPQRRVSLPAPACTTRINGGPRLHAVTPLPPYRASPGRTSALAVRHAPVEHAGDAACAVDPGVPMTSPRIAATHDTFEWIERTLPGEAVLPAAPPSSVESAEPPALTDGLAGEDGEGTSSSEEDSASSARPYIPPAIVEESPTFPMDAFIIPEGTARLPSGVEVYNRIMGEGSAEAEEMTMAPVASATPDLVDKEPLSVRGERATRPRSATLREQRAHDVADRLETLATQLRHHGYEVLAQASVRGDALDALLAGVIAGYLVAAE